VHPLLRHFRYLSLIGLFVILSLTTLPGSHGQATAKLSDETEPSLDDTSLFVIGNTLFTLYHELGHALIDLLDLPVIGREEDAVDGFATLMMIADEPDPLRDELIIAVADGWRLQSDLSTRTSPFWGEHALDEQRHFAIVCLMVGSDQEGFFDFALDAGLPEERIETCADDFSQMESGWERLLAPHRPSPSADVGQPIHVAFDPPVGDHQDLERMIREQDVLSDAISMIDDDVDLPTPITVRFSTCDYANAFWDRNLREIGICYELIEEFDSILNGVESH
jgi:hypothetical protein